MNTPVQDMLIKFFGQPNEQKPQPTRSDLVFGERVIIDNLDSEHAERLAKGMGQGYGTKLIQL